MPQHSGNSPGTSSRRILVCEILACKMAGRATKWSREARPRESRSIETGRRGASSGSREPVPDVPQARVANGSRAAYRAAPAISHPSARLSDHPLRSSRGGLTTVAFTRRGGKTAHDRICENLVLNKQHVCQMPRRVSHPMKVGGTRGGPSSRDPSAPEKLPFAQKNKAGGAASSGPGSQSASSQQRTANLSLPARKHVPSIFYRR